jgi:hypothetical protein
VLSEGWTELDEREHGVAWNRFHARFRFRASTYSEDWPGFSAPDPHVTFDLSAIPNGPQRAAATQ